MLSGVQGDHFMHVASPNVSCEDSIVQLQDLSHHPKSKSLHLFILVRLYSRHRISPSNLLFTPYTTDLSMSIVFPSCIYYHFHT